MVEGGSGSRQQRGHIATGKEYHVRRHTDDLTNSCPLIPLVLYTAREWSLPVFSLTHTLARREHATTQRNNGW